MEEVWKDIIGQNGHYEISNFGKVRSTDRTIDTIRWPQKLKGKILKQRTNKTGYLFIKIRGIAYRPHRLVAEYFIDNPENKPCINHKDCNKLNNHVNNLEWVTYSQNMFHAVENGLYPLGENIKTSKLTFKDVKDIRKLYTANKYIQRELAEIYGVTRFAISKVVRNKTWKWVT